MLVHGDNLAQKELTVTPNSDNERLLKAIIAVR
jgi:hypothetical protein